MLASNLQDQKQNQLEKKEMLNDFKGVSQVPITKQND